MNFLIDSNGNARCEAKVAWDLIFWLDFNRAVVRIALNQLAEYVHTEGDLGHRLSLT